MTKDEKSYIDELLEASWSFRMHMRWARFKFWVVMWFWHWPLDRPYWNFPEDGEPYLTGLRTGKAVDDDEG